MSVICKFKCISKNFGEIGCEVNLKPVTHGSKENEKYFKYTPNGGINLGILNEEASEQFIIGKEYIVQLMPTDE